MKRGLDVMGDAVDALVMHTVWRRCRPTSAPPPGVVLYRFIDVRGWDISEMLSERIASEALR